MPEKGPGWGIEPETGRYRYWTGGEWIDGHSFTTPVQVQPPAPRPQPPVPRPQPAAWTSPLPWLPESNAAPFPLPKTIAPTGSSGWPVLLALVGAVGLIVGSFLPWLSVNFPTTATASGMDHGFHGWITVIAGAVALLVIAIAARDGIASGVVAMLAGLAGAGTGIYEYGHIHDAVDFLKGFVSFGYGLYTVIASGLLLIGAAVCLIATRRPTG